MTSEHMLDLGRPLTIGGVEFRNRVLLAPMSGVSDVPFRRQAWKYGAGMVVSEMVASEAFVTGLQEMELKSASAGLPVHMVQLAGRDAEWMAKAAERVEANGAHIIDINMGCPSKRVVNGYSGSALMRDLDHANSLIDAVVGAVKVPVTLKMRLGWDETSLNAPELARRAVESGVQMITVHGRTRAQFYKGEADWEAVRAVREVVDVPLIVNGDIVDCDTAQAALAASGADGVMVGRGSYGAPWLPGIIAGQKPIGIAGGGQWLSAITEHYEAILGFFDADFGIRHARKHLGWYLDNAERETGIHIGNDVRKGIMTGTDPNEVIRLLAVAFADPGQELAA